MKGHEKLCGLLLYIQDDTKYTAKKMFWQAPHITKNEFKGTKMKAIESLMRGPSG